MKQSIPRRTFTAGALALAAAPGGAWAQQPPRRVAIVSAARPVSEMSERGLPIFVGFFKELRRQGFAEGQNLTIERWTANGRTDLVDVMAQDVIASRPDVIFLAGGTALGPVFGPKTKTIPMVVFSGVLVEMGLAASLARPGGNLTGFQQSSGPELEGKRLQLLCDAVSTARRVALMAPQYWLETPYADAARDVAQQRGVSLIDIVLDARVSRAAFDAAFARMAAEKIHALDVAGASENAANLATIAELTAAARLPAICNTREFADLGGLMSYGVDQVALYVKCADYIVRILNGANPGELPIQLPTTFEFVVNLRAARALGLTLPEYVLVFANEVIE